MSKQFKDLNLNNAFLFAALANDPEACQLLLKLILGRDIPKVNVKTEHNILLNSETKCIRLDVNARSEYDVNYNVEAQNSNEHNIVRRSRFYQAQLDVAELKPGDDYNKLPDSFVIFICAFDPFGRGLYQYTYVEKCVEDGEPLGDGTCKIFFSTVGKNKDEVQKDLIEFLGYYENSTDEYVRTVNNPLITRLHEKMVTLKKSREWEAGYMQFEEYLATEQRIARESGLEEGRQVGLEEGRQEGIRDSLIAVLFTKGDVSTELEERIKSEGDIDVLSNWFKKSLTVNTTEEFSEEILNK